MLEPPRNPGRFNEVATNYFDKLIQVPLHVPRLGVNEAKAYLALLLLERAVADGQFVDGQFTRAVQAVAERLKTSWRGDAVTLEFLKALINPQNAHLVELMELTLVQRPPLCWPRRPSRRSVQGSSLSCMSRRGLALCSISGMSPVMLPDQSSKPLNKPGKGRADGNVNIKQRWWLPLPL